MLKIRGGWANLRNKEKTNELVGAKNIGGWANLSKKEKTNGIVGAKNRGRGGPT